MLFFSWENSYQWAQPKVHHGLFALGALMVARARTHTFALVIDLEPHPEDLSRTCTRAWTWWVCTLPQTPSSWWSITARGSPTRPGAPPSTVRAFKTSPNAHLSVLVHCIFLTCCLSTLHFCFSSNYLRHAGGQDLSQTFCPDWLTHFSFACVLQKRHLVYYVYFCSLSNLSIYILMRTVHYMLHAQLKTHPFCSFLIILRDSLLSCSNSSVEVREQSQLCDLSHGHTLRYALVIFCLASISVY